MFLDPATRTFTFTIPSVNDASAMYLIDYGDNSVIDFPKYLGSGVTISHTYQSSGVFKLNVSVYNPFSVVTKIQVLEIAADFAGFDCVPYWRPFEAPNTIEYEYKLLNGYYYVKDESNIRFYCTWLRLGLLIYILLKCCFDLSVNSLKMHFRQPLWCPKISL